MAHAAAGPSAKRPRMTSPTAPPPPPIPTAETVLPRSHVLTTVIPFLRAQEVGRLATARRDLNANVRGLLRAPSGGVLRRLREEAALRALGIESGSKTMQIALGCSLRTPSSDCKEFAVEMTGDFPDSRSSVREAVCGETPSLQPWLYGTERFEDHDFGRQYLFYEGGLCSECDSWLPAFRKEKDGEDEHAYVCSECRESASESDDGVVFTKLVCADCGSVEREASFRLDETDNHYCGRCMDAAPLRKLYWGRWNLVGFEGDSEWGPFEPLEGPELEEFWGSNETLLKDKGFKSGYVPHFVLPLWQHHGRLDKLYLSLMGHWKAPSSEREEGKEQKKTL